MRVFITGGTGLIGRHIAKRLADRGDQAVVLTRRPRHDAPKATANTEFVHGDPMLPGDWQRAVDGCDAVMNLVGQNIFGARWNDDVRRRIRDSRVFSTGNVVAAMASAKSPPRVLVQASAIGYYGPHGDEEIDERSPAGDDFMAKVCVDWENAAAPATEIGARLALIRTGVVLAPKEGALGVMTPIFKWLPGGAAPIGGKNSFAPGFGKQWMSWIHIDDIAGIFLHALDDARAAGPINGTSPQPVRNIEFSRALGKAVRRPVLPFGPPDALLKLVLGDVTDVIAKGAKVLPKAAEGLGYRFAYPDVASALAQIFQRAPAPGVAVAAAK